MIQAKSFLSSSVRDSILKEIDSGEFTSMNLRALTNYCVKFLGSDKDPDAIISQFTPEQWDLYYRKNNAEKVEGLAVKMAREANMLQYVDIFKAAALDALIKAVATYDPTGTNKSVIFEPWMFKAVKFALFNARKKMSKRRTDSLDRDIKGSSSRGDAALELSNFIKDPAEGPFETLEKKQLVSTIMNVLKSLSDNDYDIIVHSYGLAGETPKQSKEIGLMLGQHPVSVNRSRSRIISKLREELAAIGIESFQSSMRIFSTFMSSIQGSLCKMLNYSPVRLRAIKDIEGFISSGDIVYTTPSESSHSILLKSEKDYFLVSKNADNSFNSSENNFTMWDYFTPEEVKEEVYYDSDIPEDTSGVFYDFSLRGLDIFDVTLPSREVIQLHRSEIPVFMKERFNFDDDKFYEKVIGEEVDFFKFDYLKDNIVYSNGQYHLNNNLIAPSEKQQETLQDDYMKSFDLDRANNSDSRVDSVFSS